MIGEIIFYIAIVLALALLALANFLAIKSKEQRRKSSFKPEGKSTVLLKAKNGTLRAEAKSVEIRWATDFIPARERSLLGCSASTTVEIELPDIEIVLAVNGDRQEGEQQCR